MSSLIQIFLRPNCRTIKGFCQLIVKEWIIRGHPFRERFGQVIFDADRLPAQEVRLFLKISKITNLFSFSSHPSFFSFSIVFINYSIKIQYPSNLPNIFSLKSIVLFVIVIIIHLHSILFSND